ncbi:MAG: dephospho-CoA kinase [Actinomycetota bacterium]
MLLVVLTGGIGAGKSSVSEAMAARGAVIVDADAIVKELQQPDGAIHRAMVDRWGATIVADDGGLDRQAVADIVFNDADELKALNEIVHPETRAEMRRQAEANAGTDRVVVLDLPLLGGRDDAAKRGASAIVVVDCPVEVAIQRLIEHRGFERDDAEARIANQVGRDERLGWADFVVDNGGDLDQLAGEIDRCWTWLRTLEHGAALPER